MAEGEIVENGMFYFARRQLLEQGLFQVGTKSKHCKKNLVLNNVIVRVDTVDTSRCLQSIPLRSTHRLTWLLLNRWQAPDLVKSRVIHM